MANYKYRCSDCGNVFDIVATIQEKEEDVGEKFACPQCHSPSVKSEFSVGNFIKNIFVNDNKVGSCCPDKNSCDTNCEAEENKKNCGNGTGNSGCCR